jgi:hypothetical protein
MNILPIALVFLSILSLLSYNFLKETTLMVSKEKISLGYLEASRLLQKEIQKSGFDWIKEKKEASETALPTLKEQKTSKSSAHIGRSKGFSKMNLLPLFLKEKDPAQELEILKKVLSELYLHHPTFSTLSKPNSLDLFCIELINLCKNEVELALKEGKKSSEIDLKNLQFSSREFSTYFYKMLKGTQFYKVKYHKHKIEDGYPPFLDYFEILEEKKEKLFSFPSLSKSHLEMIFGEKVAFEILKKEQEVSASMEKGSYILNQSELTELLQKNFFSQKEILFLLSCLDFQTQKRKKSKKQIIENSTLITLEIVKES